MEKQELMQNRAETLYYKKYIDNIQQIPTSATISITTESGSDMPTPVSTAAMIIDTYGTMSYTVTATNTANLGENFIAEVIFVIGGTTYLERFLFDIVKNKLLNIVIDEDLENDYQKLKQLYYTTYGEVSSIGNLNQIIDNKNLNESLNYYSGCKVKMLSGNNQDWSCNIASFNETTRTLTLKSNAPVAMVVGDKFVIQKSYETEIQRAFEEIKDWLRTRGYRPALIINDYDIRELHITCSVMKVLHGLGAAERKEFEDYEKKYLQQREELKILYDTDESGEPDDSDDTRPQVTFRR